MVKELVYESYMYWFMTVLRKGIYILYDYCIGIAMNINIFFNHDHVKILLGDSTLVFMFFCIVYVFSVTDCVCVLVSIWQWMWHIP